MARLFRMLVSTIRFLLSPERVLNWITLILIVIIAIAFLFSM